MGVHDRDAEPGETRHVGLALWAAAEAWRQRLTAAMAAKGVEWYGEARAALIPHIGSAGVRMADLPARTGLSRQAVHQLVLALEADGIVTRAPDPCDARGRFVRFTARGLDIKRMADTAKCEIDQDYAGLLGEEGFAAFLTALDTIALLTANDQVKIK